MNRLRRFARPALVQALVVLIGLALVFHSRFEGDFVWDDVYYVEKNAVLVHGPLRDFFTPAMWGISPPPAQFYRPIPMLTLGFQTWWTGLSLPAYRVGNALLHAASSWMLFAWLRQQRVGAWVAVLASLAFAFHPSACESVMWVMGRGDLLATLFTLAALVVWRPTLARAVCAGLFAGLAFLSKEPFAFVPLLLGLNHVYARWRDDGQLVDRGLLFLAPAFLFDLGVVGLRSAVGVSTASSGLNVGVVRLLRVIGTILAHYAKQLATWSNGATVEDFQLASDTRITLTWLVFIAVGTSSFARARRGSAPAAGILFGVLVFALALAPLALALPFTGMFGNRYAYFPLVAMFVVLAHVATLLVTAIEQRAARLLPVVVGAAIFAIGLSGLSMSVEAFPWHDAVTLFAYDVGRSPRDPKALYHYAHALGASSGCQEAVVFYERAVQADPTYTRAWHNLTGCLVNVKRYGAAINAGDRALALSGGAPRDEYNLGVALSGAGRREDAIAHLERAITLDPGYAPAKAALAKARAAP